jgi:hypothetical protein
MPSSRSCAFIVNSAMRNDSPQPWSRRFTIAQASALPGRAARAVVVDALAYLDEIGAAAGPSRSVRQWNVSVRPRPGLNRSAMPRSSEAVVSPPARGS